MDTQNALLTDYELALILARLLERIEREIAEIGGCDCGANEVACIVRCEETGKALEMICEQCLGLSRGAQPEPGKALQLLDPPMYFTCGQLKLTA
jgi:hypothetical protein